MQNILDAPLAQLLSRQRARRSKLPAWWVVALLYGLPTLLTLALMGEAGAVFLATTTLGLILGLPLFFFKTEVSLLSSLRKGRCLEEMVSAGLSASAVVDTLAFHSLVPISQVCLRVSPVLLLGTLLTPAGLRGPLLGLIVAWPVLVALLFIWGSYFAQARSLTDGSWSLSSFFLGLVAAGNLSALAFTYFHPLLGLPFLVSLAAATPWFTRQFAISALNNPARLDLPDDGPFRARGHRNRWVPVWSDNLIVARECARGASLRGGLQGYVVLRLLGIFVPLLLGLYLSASLQGSRLWECMLVLAPLYFLRSASRTIGAVVNERGQKTWESLVQAGVSFDEFRKGWIQVGTLPFWLESIPVLLLVGVYPLLCPIDRFLPSWLLGPVLCLTLVWLAWLGAAVGLALSSVCANQQESGALLVRTTAGALTLWLTLWGLAYFVGLWLAEHCGGFYGFEWTDIAFHLVPLASLLVVGRVGQAWAQRTLKLGLSHAEFLAPKIAGQPTLRPFLGGALLGAWAPLLERHWQTYEHRFYYDARLAECEFWRSGWQGFGSVALVGVVVGLGLYRVWPRSRFFKALPILASILSTTTVVASSALIGYLFWELPLLALYGDIWSQLFHQMLPLLAWGALAGAVWSLGEVLFARTTSR